MAGNFSDSNGEAIIIQNKKEMDVLSLKKALRALCLFLIVSLILPLHSLYAENSIQVLLNGSPLKFDTQPIIQNDRVFVPMRTIFESLGYQINWDDTSQTVTGTKSDSTLSLTIGNTNAVKNNEVVSLDTPPVLINGSTLVPLRFVAESADAQVNWDSASSTVMISESVTAPQAPEANNIAPAAQTAPMQLTPAALAQQKLVPTVVTIHSDHMQGSGVIISPNGYIATNFHVLDKTRSLKITFSDGKIYEGDVVMKGYDYARDIVILKIDGQNLPYAELGGDSSTLQVGDEVITIGSPNGIRNTVSYGAIKGVNSQIINTSAKIDHGSSGGACFDKSGKLIGIVSAFGGTNYYSIPIDYVKKLPVNQTIPASEIANIPLPVLTPRFFDAQVDGNTVNFFWEPVYGPDYFYAYISSSENEGYTRVWNPVLNSNRWYWDYPACFTLSSEQSGTFYMKVVSVLNGVESPPTAPIKITIP